MADLEKSLLEKKEDEPEPEPKNTAFLKKLSLAKSMAFWVTLFYVPIVIPEVHQMFFVDADVPTLLHSPDFKDYWPNTVQLIVFTVYFSTGSTVQLAWQGLAGTLGAGVNQFIMGKLFPLGGKCLKASHLTGNGLRGFCEEYADPNYGEYWWFVWIDVFFFMFLILSSNAKENTVKFGLSWHCTYMMLFMSPAGYTPSHAVNITSVIGVTLAILITLIPSISNGRIAFEQMVANNLEGHPESIADKVEKISVGMVKFMLGQKPRDAVERSSFKVDRMAIERTIEELEPMAGNMSSDHETSWWEGWLYILNGGPSAVANFRKVRQHCGIFAKAFADDIGGFDDVAFLMKKTVTAMDASVYKVLEKEDLDDVEEERESLRGSLNALNDSSMSLLKKITCKDVSKDKDMKQTIGGMKEECDGKFKELYEAYIRWTEERPVMNKSAGRQVMRRNMTLCVFAVLQMAKEIMDLAEKVLDEYEKISVQKTSDLVLATSKDFLSQLQGTWFSGGKPAMFKALFDPDKRSFVFRNLLSIGLCFFLGNILQGNVFSPYNSLLAGTLSVLISHYPGSAFYKNLMRLLGLAIGNALPIIILAICDVRLLGPYLHLLMFFLFELYFGLMYYTSPEWAYIGCIVAGFGCYSFTTDTWSKSSFDAAYCKIGNVTAAIAVQIIVDMVDTWLRDKFPASIVLENMELMTKGGKDASGAQVDGILQVFQKFQKHLSSDEPDPEGKKMKEITKAVETLKGIMASQETLVDECKPKTTMIGGPKPAFKLDLYTGTLAAVKEMLGEIDALCLVDEFSGKVSDLRRSEWYDQQYNQTFNQVLSNMEYAFDTFMKIMKTTGKVGKNKVKLCTMDEVGSRMSAVGGISEQGEGVRMTVVKRIIGDTLQHVLQIEQLCCSSGSLEFEN